MGQLRKGLLTIDNAHTVPHRALTCGPGLVELSQVLNHPWPEGKTIYIN